MSRKLNNKQKLQVAVAALAAILIIVWIFLPGMLVSKILGILSNALLLLSMILSFREEEKKKSDKQS